MANRAARDKQVRAWARCCRTAAVSCGCKPDVWARLGLGSPGWCTVSAAACPPRTMWEPCPASPLPHPMRSVQVLKEKLREALEANKALQAQLGKGGSGAAGSGARVALGAENKENAAH